MASGERQEAAGSSEEKAERIGSWLKKIFEVQYIPDFPVNARNIDALYEIGDLNEAVNKDASFLIDDLKQRAAEYGAQTEYLKNLLRENLGLSPCSLSSKGRSYLNVLVDSAMTLETKDTSLASFFCAINNMSLELYETESKNNEKALELTRLRKKLSSVLVLEQRLNEELKKIEEQLKVRKATAYRRSQNLKFLTDKSVDLKIRIKAAEEKLIASELSTLLMHDSLLRLSEELAAKQKEIKSVKKELEVLLDLPLSISLAKVKIEEVKQELDAMDAELTKEIDKITFDI